MWHYCYSSMTKTPQGASVLTASLDWTPYQRSIECKTKGAKFIEIITKSYSNWMQWLLKNAYMWNSGVYNNGLSYKKRNDISTWASNLWTVYGVVVLVLAHVVLMNNLWSTHSIFVVTWVLSRPTGKIIWIISMHPLW